MFYRIVYSDNRSADNETKVTEFIFFYFKFEVDSIAGVFAQHTIMSFCWNKLVAPEKFLKPKIKRFVVLQKFVTEMIFYTRF